MAHKAAADGDGPRTETTRHTTEISADDLIEGDRIARELVARHPDELGEPINQHRHDREHTDTCLLRVTQIDGMDDTHSAVLIDPETGTMVRATRHDRQSAWTQSEADWSVCEVGQRPVVEEVYELRLSSRDDPVDDETDYIEGWAEVVLPDIADQYSDIRAMDGRTLRLEDIDGRRALAKISLVDD
jgi:hypothetical protein